MIYLCVALMVIGVICLIAEMFMPGFGVFGFSGVGCLVVAGLLAVLYVPYGWVVVTAEVAVLAGFFGFMFTYIKKKQLRGKLIMNEALQDDLPADVNLDDLLGREGEAATSMRPVGDVDFNGFKLEATSDGAYIEKGNRVKVTEIRDNKIIVRKVNAWQ